LLLPLRIIIMMMMHQTSFNCSRLRAFVSNANLGQMQNATPDGRLSRVPAFLASQTRFTLSYPTQPHPHPLPPSPRRPFPHSFHRHSVTATKNKLQLRRATFENASIIRPLESTAAARDVTSRDRSNVERPLYFAD